MTLIKFIKENKNIIDECIREACTNCGRINNEERRLWILNDEVLYNLARSKGVRI